MIGAIVGDIIGSMYEINRVKVMDFPLFPSGTRFTDDTVMTVAVADCILNKKEYAVTFKEYGKKYPYVGYGPAFKAWLFMEDNKPYNSFGNGSAMRVSPVGFAYEHIDDVLAEAKRSAEVSHNHPEGIKGAQAVAAAIFLARKGRNKKAIREYIESTFMYNLSRTLDDIRPHYNADATCQGSVPEAIIAFLESSNYEDSVRKAISLGGDADTMACIAGGIAQAFYKTIPDEILKKVREFLPPDLFNVTERFMEKYCR